MILGLFCVTVLWKSCVIFFRKKLVMLDCIHLIPFPQTWLFSQQWPYMPTQNIVWFINITLIVFKHISQQFFLLKGENIHSFGFVTNILSSVYDSPLHYVFHVLIAFSFCVWLFLCSSYILFLRNAVNGETSRHADFLFLLSWCT